MTEKQLIGLLNRSLNTLDKLTKMSHETLADQSQLISIIAPTQRVITDQPTTRGFPNI